ncbi:MAG: aminoacyl-tRNA hydrolase [bacterium]|nr:aminoacyl-tRNA hydrolase [bacterium]
MKLDPKLIIGLGNPDKEYDNTYHNAGFLFIDFLIKNKPPKARLLKSEVYMNRSGNFVSKTIKKTGTKPLNLLIAHDDSDLAIGQFKLSFGRGPAGHKGVIDIIKAIKTQDFWRLRIGIRPQREKIRQKAEKFVLKKISSANKKIFESVFKQALTNITSS